MDRIDPMTSTNDRQTPRRAWIGAWVVVAVVAAGVKSVVVYAPALADAFVEGQAARFGEPAIAMPAEPPEQPVAAGDEPLAEDLIRVEYEGESSECAVTGQRVIIGSLQRATGWLCLIS